MKRFYVWIRPDHTYYYKFIKGHYKYNSIGDVNSYNHTLILIIDNPYKRPSICRPRPLKRFLGWIYKNM